jgi:hypothetical protein
VANPISGASIQSDGMSTGGVQAGGRGHLWKSTAVAIYLFALIAALYQWLAFIREPLNLDETGSYWQISGGFRQLWLNRFVVTDPPAYSYVLWFATRILGTSEAALRVPSVVAMLAAAVLLYLIARDIFDRELALVAVALFCLNPIVIFASIDARPYALAVMVLNAAILVLIRLRNSDSCGLAALYGFLSAGIIYFHYLFALILPALLFGFFVIKSGRKRPMWHQASIAMAAFVVAALPLASSARQLVHSSGTHICDDAPMPVMFVLTLLPIWVVSAFFIAGLLGLLLASFGVKGSIQRIRLRDNYIVVFGLLAITPVLILYAVSVATPLHSFADRHRLPAIPGIVLCWTLLASQLRPRAIQRLFVVLLATFTLMSYGGVTNFGHRSYRHTWKNAIEAAERNAAMDHTPVLVCSGFVEGASASMPTDEPEKSRYFTPLSYYRMSVPIIPLPYALNDETVRAGTRFLKDSEHSRRRFLAMGNVKAYSTLDWLRQITAGSYSVRDIGTFDDIKVLEFDPVPIGAVAAH